MMYVILASFYLAVMLSQALCTSCDYGYIWDNSSTFTVNLGEEITFTCFALGTDLNWFVDGVNVDNITTEELEKREISLGAIDEQYNSYNDSCDTLNSTLCAVGNCLNNNTKMHCMVVGAEPNSSSSIVKLTVKGHPVIINDFTVSYTTANSITVLWDVTPIENSSLTLDITDSYGTVNDTVNVTGMNNSYEYIETISSPCNVYAFKLAPHPLLAGCNNISVISAAIFPKPENITASYVHDEILRVNFQIQYQCFNSTIQLLLVGADGTSDISDSLPIRRLTYNNRFYELNWRTKLRQHSLYYVTINIQWNAQNRNSDATEISTYNVKDIIIARNSSNICFMCVTAITASKCQVIIASSTTFLRPTQQNASCYYFSDNGTYIVYVHDIDENGRVVPVPAIVKEYVVNWTSPQASVPSSSVIDVTPSSVTSTVYILGGFLGLAMIGVLILAVSIIIILIYKNTKTKTDCNITVDQNIAYEMVNPVTSDSAIVYDIPLRSSCKN